MNAWQNRAVCAGLDPNIFTEKSRVPEARRICLTCPVAVRCGRAGQGMAAGVWGGEWREAMSVPSMTEPFLKSAVSA